MSNSTPTDFKYYGLSTSDVLLTIYTTITKNNLIDKGDCVLVALSGGADSVCLLDALCKLREKLEIKVAAAHLNHMIRGKDADSDEAYAAELCTKMGIPFFAERVNVPEIAKTDGISEELAGRNARYEFFNKICSKHKYTKIATAHNKNDKAETLLMRVIRGTGIDGLCSIKYSRDNIIRPLLDVMRDKIEDYCRENSLNYCTDKTNLSSEYTRNKVRNELIPMIEREFNPKITEALCTLADNSREDADFINAYAERLYNRINSPMPRRRPVIMDIETLKMLGESIQNRLIRIAVRDAMGDIYNLERGHIEAVRGLFDKETGASVSLPFGLVVGVKYGWLEFATQEDLKKRKAKESFSYEIEIGDELTLMEYDISFEVTECMAIPKANQMVVDYDKICTEKLFVRNRRSGDRINIYKDGRTRKLKDYFIDKKIPKEERDNILLLCTEKEVVAIIGDRVAEKYKVTDGSERSLVIQYGKDNENRQNYDKRN